MWWRESGRLALDREGYLYLLPVCRRLGHVEDDPPVPVKLEADKAWLAAERAAEQTREDEVREWSGYYRDGLV